MVFCLGRGACLHMAHRMPLSLNVSCFSKIQIGFTFPVPAHPGSPGQNPEGRKTVVVVLVRDEGVAMASAGPYANHLHLTAAK